MEVVVGMKILTADSHSRDFIALHAPLSEKYDNNVNGTE